MTIRYSVPTVSVLMWLAACSDGADVAPPAAGGTASMAGSVGVAGSASGGGAGGTSGGGASSGGSGGSASGQSGSGGSSAGTAGSGGGVAMPAKPFERDGEWVFELGEATLQVAPMHGGRITTLQLGTENLLTGPDVNPLYWGSTLWISPEATLWKQPPPEELDSAPYAVTTTDTSVTLTSMPYEMLGITITKKLTTDPALGAFKVEYTLNNVSAAEVKMAPWEVTRVKPRGVTFFPKGSSQSLSMGATFPTTEANGITWYTYDAAAVTVDSKLYADASEGWLAHAAAGLVFIKSFPDLQAADIAPKEGDVELYTNALHTYVELENQGAYVTIPAGASSSWTVTWFLRKLPAGVGATPGNAALAQFVRDTIAGK